jgi:hypothetical protein
MSLARWRSPALIIATGLLVTAWSSRASAGQPSMTTSLTWDEAFPIASAANEVRIDAHFQGSDGMSHRLRLWRHGTSFLHRQTDEALDLYVRRASATANDAYRLIDHRRHITMDVRRDQLYRIGVFSDWFGLAYGIDRPKTPFTVRALSVSARERRQDCTWRLLVRSAKGSTDESRVCWSPAWGIPLAIRTKDAKGGWSERFTVERVEAIAPSTDGPAIPSAPDGYASFDAGNEIDPQSGD